MKREQIRFRPFAQKLILYDETIPTMKKYCCIVVADYKKSLVKNYSDLARLEMEGTPVGSHCILWLKLFPICMIPGMSKL